MKNYLMDEFNNEKFILIYIFPNGTYHNDSYELSESELSFPSSKSSSFSLQECSNFSIK